MKSKTKYYLDNEAIKNIFSRLNIKAIEIKELAAGQYNCAYYVKGNDKSYVLKIAPDINTDTLTYERNIMKSEVYWYEQLKKYTDINTPEIYYSDFTKSVINADYFIMEYIDAKQQNKTKMSKSEKIESKINLAKMTSQMHKINGDKFGYIQSKQYDNWYLAIRAMVEDLIDDCHRAGKKTRRGNRLLKYIEMNKNILERVECTMVNFDLWEGNILCKKENGNIEYFLIDPERSFWGDRILDFCLLEFTKPLFKKILSINAYNITADNKISVRKGEKIRHAIGLGYLALIQESEKYYRYTPINSGWWMTVFGSAFLYYTAFKELKKYEKHLLF